MEVTNPMVASTAKTSSVADAHPPLALSAGAHKAHSVASASIMLSADEVTQAVSLYEVTQFSHIGQITFGHTSMGSCDIVPSSDQHWCAMSSCCSVVAI